MIFALKTRASSLVLFNIECEDVEFTLSRLLGHNNDVTEKRV